jgi:translation initiation factor 1
MAKRTRDQKMEVSSHLSGGLNPAFASLDGLHLPPPASSMESEALVPVKEKEAASPKAGRVVLRRETGQRAGKTVVVVSGFESHITQTGIETMARELRKACGCGGTVQGREIEIQGDQPARVAEFFRQRNFRVVGVVA